ncbi:hypothetical protein LRAMOSA02105 [Lichtheimia ramosa]|uniref:F-box domain-containing protein n=1 Tax=Lichtheimia ramosa TaxID=688394 RepID=A0A077WN07_9FUNG|nr:hypothetical protein LRAMOSA02105 [Lichtheimia ramosa]
MDLCVSDSISPPATPPSDTTGSYHQPLRYAHPPKNTPTCLQYIASVKGSFMQLTNQQQQLLLSELVPCCDNQQLSFLHSLIVPRLKVDFIRQLPIELALHVLSFIDDDPYTLSQAACVSSCWNAVLKDESVWKSMCHKHLKKRRRSLLHGQENDMMTTMTYHAYYQHMHLVEKAWRHGGSVRTCSNSIRSALVTSLQVDDPYIVVGCDNHNIEVFDSNTGESIYTLSGHQGGVWALQFVKKNEYETILVSGGCDRILRVWELNTGMEQYRLTGHTSTIRCVKISVDDPRIAVSGSRDASLRIWDVEQGQVRHVCWGHQASVRCIDIHDQRVVSGSYDHTARLWDMNTGECIHTFIGHRSQIYTILFDGTRVITGSLDSHIRVWSADTGCCLATLQGHTSLVGHLQLLPSDPSILVSGGSDGCLRVWDLDHYECRNRISAHDNSVTCMQFDDRHILSGGSDGCVKLWDLETGTLIRTFTDPARTVWKLQFKDTKAVVVLQKTSSSDQPTTTIELHHFD